jgi:hypothetical protein
MISRISLAVGTSGLLSLFEGVIVADRKVSHSEGRKEGRKEGRLSCAIYTYISL